MAKTAARPRMLRLEWIPRRAEGGCHFCDDSDDRSPNVLTIESKHPQRHWSVRICRHCLDELRVVMR